MSKNRGVKNLLASQYGNKCMLSGQRYNLTYHHIEKEENGGETSLENGALVSDIGQSWLHNYIEQKDIELFDLINECLLLYKRVIELDNVQLLKQYRDEVIPLFQQAIWDYHQILYQTHRKQKKLVKRINKGEQL